MTLIELLVVLGVISILTAIMVPCVRKAKSYASGAICLSNQKTLCAAWLLYAQENVSRLVGGSNYFNGSHPTPYRWVEQPLLRVTDNPGDPGISGDLVPGPRRYCLDYRLNGIRAGKLFPYVTDVRVYHCPADPTMKKYSEPFAVYRSYAIAGLMNSGDYPADGRSPMPWGPITVSRIAFYAGEFREFRMALKLSDIVSPDTKFVFIEENVEYKFQDNETPQFFNYGGFNLWKRQDSWADYPAAFHGQSGSLAFADGHAQLRRWEDPRTLSISWGGQPAESPHQPANPDLEWLMRGYLPCR